MESLTGILSKKFSMQNIQTLDEMDHILFILHN